MKAPEANPRLLNNIRIHRRRTALSQRELGEVLGYPNEVSVARHERFQATPPLQIAIGYELIFHIPISEIFAGLRDDVATEVEAKFTELEERLGQRSATDRDAITTARKLTWLSQRRNADMNLFHEGRH